MKVSNSLRMMRYHMLSHKPKTDFRSHGRMAHKSKASLCEICDQYFVFLKGHVNRVHNKEINFWCQHCPKQFYAKNNYDSHVYYKHGAKESIFKCEMCPKKYAFKKVLEDHTKRIHSTGFDFPCDFCDSKFKVRRVLLKHIEGKHSITNEVFTCNVCSKQVLSKSKLSDHNKIHMEKIKCDQCSVLLKPSCLKAHIRNKHNQTKKMYPCNVCSKKFTSRNALQIHTQNQHTTSTKKDHICLTCTTNFTTSNSLQVHQITHTSNKPYICVIPDCMKSYNNAGSLSKHKRNHEK